MKLKFKQAIASFLQFLEVEKRYSQHTIISYRNDLYQLQKFLASNYEMEDVLRCGSQQLRSFIVHLLENGMSQKTVNRKVSTVRRFFNYLQKREIIADDITDKLIPPKIPKRLPEFIKESEGQLLQEMIVDEDFECIRDLTIVQVFYFTGIRRAELIELKLWDLDFSGKRLKVLGKGGKERYVPLAPILINVIRKYQKLRSEVFPESTCPYLFLTAKGKKLYPKGVYNIVRRQLAQLTSAKKRSPHILRHSFASHLLNNGADLNAIKEILGHANLSATQVYTHNSISKLKEAYRNAHPKSRS